MLKAAVINATNAIGHHGCTLVCTQINALAAEAGINVANWLPLSTSLKKTDWSKLDFVIVNGEGTLHHDRAGARAIAELGTSLARISVPAYLINTVYQDNSLSIAAGVEKFRGIWVRESLSASAVRAHGLSSTVVPDLSLNWIAED